LFNGESKRATNKFAFLVALPSTCRWIKSIYFGKIKTIAHVLVYYTFTNASALLYT
jgi:hypothetical protein